jgi:hypothetical protein
VDKTKAKLARLSGKTAYETPDPTNLKLKTQKNHLCQARNFFIFFALLDHPLPAVAFR